MNRLGKLGIVLLIALFAVGCASTDDVETPEVINLYKTLTVQLVN